MCAMRPKLGSLDAEMNDESSEGVVVLGRIGGGNGINWFPSDPSEVPLRTFHRLTSRKGGMSDVSDSPCLLSSVLPPED